jgi:phytoene dehydrogenase-like protein
VVSLLAHVAPTPLNGIPDVHPRSVADLMIDTANAYAPNFGPSCSATIASPLDLSDFGAAGDIMHGAELDQLFSPRRRSATVTTAEGCCGLLTCVGPARTGGGRLARPATTRRSEILSDF